MGLSAPGALGQTLGAMGVNTPGVNDGSCRTMALPLVYALTLMVILGAFVGLFLVKRRLTKEGWSLANALSEPTRLTIPVEMRWTESGGDRMAMGLGATASSHVIRGADGTPMAMTLLEASSSRMIATLGGLGILMLYMGFGGFALYSFGLTCQLPDSMPAVSTFLLSGLSLFAPYVANKISTAIQPNIRSSSVGPAAPPSPSQIVTTTAADSPGRSAAAQDRPAYSSPAPERPLLQSTAALSSTDPAGPAATRPAPQSPPPDRQPLMGRAPAADSSPGPADGRANPTPPISHRQVSGKPAPAPAKAAPSWAQEYGPALAMIREFEGFVDHAYPDPATGADPWTIGYGFTTLEGRPVQPGQTITPAEADEELQRQAQVCANHLAATIPYWQQMTSNQRCALLDFAWNLGSDFYGDEENFGTITRDLKTHDWAQVPQTFLLYCDPGTAVEAGLLRRRQAEANLWTTPVTTREASNPARGGEEPTRPAPVHSRFSNPLKVPYNDQLLMADGQGWRECFSASSAMLAMYWGKEPNENVYDKLRARYGDSTNSDAQLGALRSLGLTANFYTDGTVAMLKQEIDAGRPVAVGWLCDGPVSAPSGGGHWIVVIGYDDTGFLVNDPYGNCDLINGGYLSHDDGAGLHYSYQNWVPRWRVDGTGGWMLTCKP
ncbi:MAG: C39 family peptidase [Cyanobacteriota bacterium]|nr:C39 family peptidase [Cyanobacteriota bacterium]